jgi:uncharacterized membrane protein
MRPLAAGARLVSLTFAGLFAGFLVAVLVLELTLRDHDAHTYTQVRHVELARLDDLASATLIPALIATIVLTVLTARTRGRGFWLTAAALALLVTVLVMTLVVNVPINNDQLDWSVRTPPADWASVRDEWQIAHAVRTAAATLAFGCLAIAVMAAPLTTSHKEQKQR